MRLVDPDTRAPLPGGQPGLLLVRGPNVMQGYLGRDDLTRQALVDGWYVTGDIARIDDDGFLGDHRRPARASRRSAARWCRTAGRASAARGGRIDVQVFAVTAVADERKGESLAVLHTLAEERIATVLERVAASGLPNLFIPRRERFGRCRRCSAMGADLREVKRLAAESLGHARAPPSAPAAAAAWLGEGVFDSAEENAAGKLALAYF
ncbi:MAG: AMP-binding protein [Planctomycetota bacterium]